MALDAPRRLINVAGCMRAVYKMLWPGGTLPSWDCRILDKAHCQRKTPFNNPLTQLLNGCYC